jgi:hypothetical protein
MSPLKKYKTEMIYGSNIRVRCQHHAGVLRSPTEKELNGKRSKNALKDDFTGIFMPIKPFI